jgi:hypothetical protein
VAKQITLAQPLSYTRACDVQERFTILPGTYAVFTREYFPGRPFEAIMARIEVPVAGAPQPAEGAAAVDEIEIPVRRLHGACFATLG